MQVYSVNKMKTELQKKLNKACMTHKFAVGYSFYNIITKETFSHFGDNIIPSASTRKIFILAYTLKQVHNNKLSLEEKLEFDVNYKDSNSGLLRYFNDYPLKISLRNALILMIAISDNSCTKKIIEILGLENIDEYLKSIGIKKSVMRFGSLSSLDSAKYSINKTNITTPNEMLLMLKYFYEGSLNECDAQKIQLSSELCILAISFLKMQQFNDRLPFLLPKKSIVAHKTGTRHDGYHDVGIIYHEEIALFILSVYTSNVPQLILNLPGKFVASSLISKLARICFDSTVKDFKS